MFKIGFFTGGLAGHPGLSALCLPYHLTCRFTTIWGNPPTSEGEIDMSKRHQKRGANKLRRRDETVMRRYRKRGERQKFRSEIRPYLAV